MSQLGFSRMVRENSHGTRTEGKAPKKKLMPEGIEQTRTLSESVNLHPEFTAVGLVEKASEIYGESNGCESKVSYGGSRKADPISVGTQNQIFEVRSHESSGFHLGMQMVGDPQK